MGYYNESASNWFEYIFWDSTNEAFYDRSTGFLSYAPKDCDYHIRFEQDNTDTLFYIDSNYVGNYTNTDESETPKLKFETEGSGDAYFDAIGFDGFTGYTASDNYGRLTPIDNYDNLIKDIFKEV